jgi:hypothetical protein
MTKIHIILGNNTVVNLDMPADFDFNAWVRAVRADGYVMGPNLYISMAAIAAILGADQKFEVKPPGATVQ